MPVLPDVTTIVAITLAEDLGVSAESLLEKTLEQPLLLQDVTSSSTLKREAWFSGRIVSRQDSVVAGLPVVIKVFELLSEAAGLSSPVLVSPLVAEGEHVAPGTVVAEVEGPATAVLSGERTALNFLMLLSGIATETARWVEAAGDTLAVCDTRKTIPGMRLLSKYAVAAGGGTNHRMGLHDMVLIKDNHINWAGGITAAVSKARVAHPNLLIETEADCLSQALEAVRAGTNLVLLDNMNDAELAESVIAIKALSEELGHTVVTEASGGIVFERLSTLRETGVDRVSTSAITMVNPVDFGLDEIEPSR